MGTNIVNVATPPPATMHARVEEASSSYVEVTQQYLDAVERSAVQQGVPSPGTAPMSGGSCGMSCAQLCFSCGQLCQGFACGQLCFACGQLCWGMSCGQLCFACGQLCWGMSCGMQGLACGQPCPGCGCRCSRCGAQDADEAVGAAHAGAEAGQGADPPAPSNPKVGVVAGAGPAPGAEA